VCTFWLLLGWHPTASLMQEWEQSVTNGRNVLRNTYIATYYMDRCNERLYLEALQQRLEGELGQLTEMLRQLPHRRAMLEGARLVPPTPGLDKNSVSALLAMMFAMIRDISHGFLCTILRVLNAQSTVLEEVSLRGRQVRSSLSLSFCVSVQVCIFGVHCRGFLSTMRQ
jgi:hypothetical protein